jgi:hypothetical protein
MGEVFSSRLGLTNQPISHPDVEYVTDGSNFVWDGIRFAGYAPLTLYTVIEARLLPVGTSAQKAELIALTQVLQLRIGVWVNIYVWGVLNDLDFGTLLHLKLVTITHESSSYRSHSFYEEMQSEFPISVKTKNPFLSLVESITQTLIVTLCYVCGGTNMGNHQPWEARAPNPQEPFNETTLPSIRFLKTSIIGITASPIQKANSPAPSGELLGTKVLH